MLDLLDSHDQTNTPDTLCSLELYVVIVVWVFDYMLPSILIGNFVLC